MIKPFKWLHPLISNLPDKFLHILGSPFPILVGLNKEKAFVKENNLNEIHTNCVFIMLDGEIEILNENLIADIKEG